MANLYVHSRRQTLLQRHNPGFLNQPLFQANQFQESRVQTEQYWSERKQICIQQLSEVSHLGAVNVKFNSSLITNQEAFFPEDLSPSVLISTFFLTFSLTL